MGTKGLWPALLDVGRGWPLGSTASTKLVIAIFADLGRFLGAFSVWDSRTGVISGSDGDAVVRVLSSAMSTSLWACSSGGFVSKESPGSFSARLTRGLIPFARLVGVSRSTFGGACERRRLGRGVGPGGRHDQRSASFCSRSSR